MIKIPGTWQAGALGSFGLTEGREVKRMADMPQKPVVSPPTPSAPPEAWEPLLKLARLASRPLERFLHIEASSGIVLLVSAAVAMIWANSPWAASYTRLWETSLGFQIGSWSFARTLAWYVNDGLMAIFFFVVGMEIRREIHHGELSELKRAALPLVAALGGMIAPAVIFLLLAGPDPSARAGWGVPMATDIAFAVGVLALLGKRVPAALRVLLLALAVIDDLGAILVIALFYSSGVSLSGLAVGALGIGGIFALQGFGVRSPLAYLAPSLVAWAGVYAAGIHPTIAGVIIGLITPVRAWYGPDGFVQGLHDELEHLRAKGAEATPALMQTLQQVDLIRRGAVSPSERLIFLLHPWVAFGIMPLFALANAGVSLQGMSLDGATFSLAIAVGTGLLLGKPIGVLIACGLALRLGLAQAPQGIGVRQLLVLGVVAGVGFTMALFIAQLAFTDPKLLDAAKMGVLSASVLAGVSGMLLGRLLLKPVQPGAVAHTADEAEASTEL